MAEDQNSGQQKKEEPIIIKKKKGHGGHGHHGGAWKVAYADFVTAMMAFFIVMWILASSQETRDSIDQYFNHPEQFDFFSGKPLVVDLNLKPTGSGKGDKEGDKDGTQPFQISFDQETVDSVVAKLQQQARADSAAAADRVDKIRQTLEEYIDEMVISKPDLEELLNSIKFEYTDEGLRVELIESSESMFFEVGSATLKPKAVEILRKLSGEIGKLLNDVEIEGHTDSRQYASSSGYTNFELSSDRANAARRVLEQTGLWEGQIKMVTGYADRKLRNPDNPFDVSNRRVSILVRHFKSDDLLPTTGEEEK